MDKTQFFHSTDQILKRIAPNLLVFAFALQMVLTGCASVGQKDDSIEDVLAKENVLIGRVKEERAIPAVKQGVSQSEALQAAEAHLGVALEEIEKANETITTKIINESKQEVNFERHAGHDRE